MLTPSTSASPLTLDQLGSVHPASRRVSRPRRRAVCGGSETRVGFAVRAFRSLLTEPSRRPPAGKTCLSLTLRAVSSDATETPFTKAGPLLIRGSCEEGQHDHAQQSTSEQGPTAESQGTASMSPRYHALPVCVLRQRPDCIGGPAQRRDGSDRPDRSNRPDRDAAVLAENPAENVQSQKKVKKTSFAP
jgi:hypothetical protein